MKLVKVIKMCLNEICSKVGSGKHVPDNFLIQNSLKEGICDDLMPLLSTLLQSLLLGMSRKPDGTEIKWNISGAGLC